MSKLSSADIVVRTGLGIEELRACQALQRLAWGIVEDGYVVPVATMAAAQKVGGLVLGAFRGEQLVGFSFAFLGRVRGRLALYSQLTAVHPEQQGRGVGRLLKREQRRRAAKMGLELVAWAFDPLQAGNAFFNLGVLGATSRTYEVDLYGHRTDALNVGLDSDRLLVEWSTRDEPRGRRERWPDGAALLETEALPGGTLRAPGRRRELAGEPRLHLEIPVSMAAVRASGSPLARAWQLAVREAFQAAFAAGYVAVGFARGERPCYLLEARP